MLNWTNEGVQGSASESGVMTLALCSFVDGYAT